MDLSALRGGVKAKPSDPTLQTIGYLLRERADPILVKNRCRGCRAIMYQVQYMSSQGRTTRGKHEGRNRPHRVGR